MVLTQKSCTFTLTYFTLNLVWFYPPWDSYELRKGAISTSEAYIDHLTSDG